MKQLHAFILCLIVYWAPTAALADDEVQLTFPSAIAEVRNFLKLPIGLSQQDFRYKIPDN